MADPRFFASAGPFSLNELADIAGAEIAATDRTTEYTDVAPLATAGPTDVSFIDNRRYVADFKRSGAGACLLQSDLVDDAPSGMALLVTKDPYRAYALVAQAFYPAASGAVGGAAPSATIDPGAKLGARVDIGPGAAIGAGTEIGADTRIGANTVVGEGVSIGASCLIGPAVTLSCCLIGDRVTVHTGVRIGQDGFGFAPGAEGHAKVPQLGRVLIGDNVEIGANSTIDRGAGPDTVIGAGTKIDNLVQIGHNVRIGKGCLIVAQVGISGSCEIGDFVMIGGQAGIAGHLKIGDGAKIAAQSGVTKDIPPGHTVAGFPAVDARQHWRKVAALGRLAGGGRDS